MPASDSQDASESAAQLHKWVRGGMSFSGHERHCCFLNTGGVRFADVSSVSGFDLPDDGRAIGMVDWDNDGDLDAWIANRSAPQLRFLRNNVGHQSNFVALRLVGSRCNRDAVGARVELQFADSHGDVLPSDDVRKTTAIGNSGQSNLRIRTLHAGDGYLSQSTKWLHFGLGKSSRAVRAVVRWPGGGSEDFGNLQVNGRYRLVQGTGHPQAVDQRPRELRLAASPSWRRRSGDSFRTRLASRVPAPQLTYTTFDGRSATIDWNRRGPTLLNLWGAWCSPCLAELKDFTDRQRELTNTGLRIVALSVPGPQTAQAISAQDSRAALDQINFPYDAGIATDKSLDILQLVNNHVFDRHRPLPVPTSFLIDTKGRLAAIYKGPLSTAQVLDDLGTLADEDLERRDYSVPFAGIWHGPPGQLRVAPLAVALAEHGYLDDAVRYADQQTDARHGDPMFARLHARVGNELFQRGELGPAMQKYRAAIELDPRFAEAHLNLAVAFVKQRRINAAIEELELALTCQPDYAKAHYQLGLLQTQLGRAEEATGHLTHAVNAQPHDTQFRLALANMLLTTGAPQSASEHLQVVITLKPDSIAAWGMLGTASAQSGADPLAVKCFQRVLQLKPDFPPAMSDLARLLAVTSDAHIHDPARAVSLAERACAAERWTNAGRMEVLAIAYAAADRIEDAVKVAEKALAVARQKQQTKLVQRIERQLDQLRRRSDS